jgi:bacterioferritin-associated ferredoxin
MILICNTFSVMYICVCQGVTDRQITEAVASGASSLEDLQDQLGVAVTCGTCSIAAAQVLHESLAMRSSSDGAVVQFYPAP